MGWKHSSQINQQHFPFLNFFFFWINENKRALRSGQKSHCIPSGHQLPSLARVVLSDASGSEKPIIALTSKVVVDEMNRNHLQALQKLEIISIMVHGCHGPASMDT